ncbi:MAG: DUF3276 family protein [Lentimicrobiaceae bacterium]|nr:DUF3276 family protein [Lentimicrobiaceae bacterium]MCO5266258.1 PUR family DNA/RNA-binding protein [Lentimicrobium sp.]
MEEFDNRDQKDEIFSKAIRAGKRTYFFDVKATKTDEYYITITESKRRFDNDNGKFTYEKHKLFLYKEDFEKFSNGLADAVNFCETGEVPVETHVAETKESINDIEFEDFDFDSK